MKRVNRCIGNRRWLPDTGWWRVLPERAAGKEGKETARETEKEKAQKKRTANQVSSTMAGTIGREVGKTVGSNFGKFGKMLGGNVGAQPAQGIFGTFLKR